MNVERAVQIEEATKESVPVEKVLGHSAVQNTLGREKGPPRIFVETESLGLWVVSPVGLDRVVPAVDGREEHDEKCDADDHFLQTTDDLNDRPSFLFAHLHQRDAGEQTEEHDLQHVPVAAGGAEKIVRHHVD